MSQKTEQMLITITEQHANQFRGDVPVTVHCRNVASLAVYAMKKDGMIQDDALLEDIALAALGHDLLEDTKIRKDELASQYGDRAADFIDTLTNHQDDQHTDEYMGQISSAPEEVRIIKYSDLVDNITSVFYNLDELGLKWGNEFFRPIMDKTIKILGSSDFSKYKVAAEVLSSCANLYANILRDRLDSKETDVQNN
ncbi:MAG: hypothetical protein WCQ49_01475 [Candidatus Saccharibacteria bacterium]